jgi:hypothetical protein
VHKVSKSEKIPKLDSAFDLDDQYLHFTSRATSDTRANKLVALHFPRLATFRTHKAMDQMHIRRSCLCPEGAFLSPMLGPISAIAARQISVDQMPLRSIG